MIYIALRLNYSPTSLDGNSDWHIKELRDFIDN